VYVGKNPAQEKSKNGLGYDVVMRLIERYTRQGYRFISDNFYTSVKLVKDLFALLTPSCGTGQENRKNFPVSMKGGKKWANKVKRGHGVEQRWLLLGTAMER
jgi:hypothetical protein